MSKSTIIIILHLCIFTNAHCNNNYESAKNLCSSCHLFPNPEIMYKEDWEYGAFPYLEHILGLNNLQNYSSEQKNEITENWNKIKDYYLKNSTNYSKKKISSSGEYNKLSVLNKINDIECSAIFYDAKDKRILIGDVNKKSIKIFDFVHSVDNKKLAQKIADEQKKMSKKIKIFIQVNIGDEEQISVIRNKYPFPRSE